MLVTSHWKTAAWAACFGRFAPYASCPSRRFQCVFVVLPNRKTPKTGRLTIGFRSLNIENKSQRWTNLRAKILRKKTILQKMFSHRRTDLRAEFLRKK